MGNVKNSVQIAAELSVNTKTFEGDVKNLLAKLDELQDAASINLQFNNLKGVGNLRKTLNELDGILKHLADSSNSTSKKLGSDISESTSKVVQDISLMSSKTGEFAEQLSVLTNTGDLSKVQGKVKALAESINAELKDTGYQIDVEKLLNLGDVQQQIDMLSEGIRKFTAVWSFFGNTCVKATDGIKTGADNASNSIDNLKRKLEELKNVKTLLNKQLQSIEDGDETALKGEEKKNIRSFAEENLSTYTKAKDTFLNTADIEKKKQAFIEMTNAAYNLLRVLNTESDAFDFTDKKKDMIFGQSMSSAIEEMESFAAQFGKRIKQSIELEIENVKQQIANAEIDIKPKINVDEAKEVLSTVEQLQKAFDIGHKKNTLEYKILFTTEGLDIREGSFQEINPKTYVESLLANLTNGININAHSHMGKYSEFTLPDIKSAIDAKKYLGINLSAVIGPNDIATLDLTKVKLEDLYALIKKLSKLPNSDKLAISAENLNKALQEINPEYTDIFQKWKPERFEEIANYIDMVSHSASNTINPLEQFKNVISFISNKDIDFSKYKDSLDSLSSSNFSPETLKNVFNEIVKAEKIMSNGELLQIDTPEKSTLDAVTKALQEQVKAYKAKRKEASITYDQIHQQVTQWFSEESKIDDSFFKRFFHPIEMDDVLKLLNGNDSLNMIAQKLATEFNIEVPVKLKTDADETESSYQRVLDILNQIVEKKKEIQDIPATKSIADVKNSVSYYEGIESGTITNYEEKIKEAFNKYYDLQKSLKNIDKGTPLFMGTLDCLEKVKSEIAGICIAAQDAGIKLEDIFSAAQLRTINAKNSGIQDLISQWREYKSTCESVEFANNKIEDSMLDFQRKLVVMMNEANLSEDAKDTFWAMLNSIDKTTGIDRIEQIAKVINDLLNGAVPQITTLKEQLQQLYPEKNLNEFKSDYSNIFNNVLKGSLTAAQALEQIKQKEEEIAVAAKEREKAQRKANEEGSKPKPSGGTAPPSGGTGTGTGGSGAGSSRTGVGAGTATPLATTNTEITNLEQLKAKLVEIQTEIARKTQAFNDENAAVSRVVSTELIELEKLKAKLVEIKTSIDEKTSAFTNEQSIVTGVVDAEIVKLGELETKLESIAQKANIKINLNADDIKNLTTLDISTDNQDIAAEDKHNQELQKKAKIYQRLNERIVETIKLQQIVNSGNMYIMPEYRDNGNLVPGLGYGIGKGYTTDNHVTKTAIKNKIKDIQNLSATNESGKNDKSINRATDELAAFVATYKNLDEAKEVFGKKETALWDEIIKRIELAKVAKDAYKKSDWNYQFMREDARTLGDSNTSYTIGDNDKLASFIKSGDVKGALGFLTEKFKIELDPEIESGAVLEEIKENTGNAPIPVEIKPTVDDNPLDNSQSSVGSVSDSALSSTLTNINSTLTTLNVTLEGFGKQDNTGKTQLEIDGFSGIAKNVEDIYGILNGTGEDGENQTLAGAIKSAVEELHNASTAITKDAELRVVSNEKYKVASERISTEAGRKDVLDRATSGYKDYIVSDDSSVKYSALSGGAVKVEAVLTDLEGKFFDFAAIVDSQGVVAVQKLEENGAKSIAVQNKLAEQEQALARAQEEAARIKQQAIDNAEAKKVKATQIVPMKSLNGVIKGTEKSYDSYFSENKVPEKLKTEYTDLLKTIEQIRTEGRNLTQDEANQIEERCRNIQKEIELLKIKKEALAEQQSLSKKYTINTDALFDTSKKGNIVGSGYEDKVKGIIQEINDELSKLKQTENGEIKILDADSIEQSKTRLKELNAELQNTIKEAQNASKGSFTAGYENSLRKLTNSFETFKQKTDGIELSDNVNETLSKYDALIKKLEELRAKMQSTKKGSDEETVLKNQWDNAIKEAQSYQKELDKILEQHEKISETGNKKVNINDIIPGIDANNIEQRHAAMQKYLDDLNLANISSSKFGQDQKTLTATFKDADGMIKQVTVSYDNLNGVVSHSIAPVEKATTGWEKLTSTMDKKVREMAAYFATFGSMYQVIGVIKQGINYVKEIDLALTELKKVTNETDQAYEQFLQTASKTSSIIGSTVADFTNATADFARLGYSISEASKLAEAASVYKNVGDGIDSISQASESIISTMKAFGIEAEDAMGIVDRFNEVKVTCLLVW